MNLIGEITVRYSKYSRNHSSPSFRFIAKGTKLNLNPFQLVSCSDCIMGFYSGAVTAVRGQGICGSCYALGAVGAVEGAYFMKVLTNRPNCEWMNGASNPFAATPSLCKPFISS